MADPTWMVRRIRWWHKPIPLMTTRDAGFEQIGWVWNQVAYCVKNASLGWIAIDSQQTEENIQLFVCKNCGASMFPSHVAKLRRHFEIQGCVKEIDQLHAMRLALTVLKRYRTETPLGNQPHMIATEADTAIIALGAVPGVAP